MDIKKELYFLDTCSENERECFIQDVANKVKIETSDRDTKQELQDSKRYSQCHEMGFSETIKDGEVETKICIKDEHWWLERTSGGHEDIKGTPITNQGFLQAGHETDVTWQQMSQQPMAQQITQPCQPVAQQPVAQQMSSQPLAQQVMLQPMAQQSMLQPMAQQSMLQQQRAQQIIQPQISHQPMAQQQMSQQQMSQQPMAQQQMMQQPVALQRTPLQQMIMPNVLHSATVLQLTPAYAEPQQCQVCSRTIQVALPLMNASRALQNYYSPLDMLQRPNHSQMLLTSPSVNTSLATMLPILNNRLMACNEGYGNTSYKGVVWKPQLVLKPVIQTPSGEAELIIGAQSQINLDNTTYNG